MATVMASRQYHSNQPPLPARNHPGQSNVTHVKIGRISNQSNHSSHSTANEQAPPPLPSREQPLRRKSFETDSFVNRNTAKAFSDPDRLRATSTSESSTHAVASPKGQSHGATAFQSKTLPHRKTQNADDAPPPLPRSLPPKKPPTNYEKLPVQPPAVPHPQPQTHRQHSQGTTAVSHAPVSTTHSPRRQEPSPEMPPQLPARPQKTTLGTSTITDSRHADSPARPPKAIIYTTHSTDEFESRFRFHAPSDFPEPEVSEVSRDKVYPSRSSSVRRTSRTSRANTGDDPLGPL